MVVCRQVLQLDFRVIGIVLILQALSLLTIASYSQSLLPEGEQASFFLPAVKSQLQWIVLGWGCFFLCALFDYAKLREWVWIIYAISIIALLGVFLTDPIARVQRWYRIPFLGIGCQPSEIAKLSMIIAVSWFLERRSHVIGSLSTIFFALIIVGIPFFLILKQPDLGTATVLYPMTLVLLFFGGISRSVLKFLCIPGFLILILVGLIFSGNVSYDAIKPHLQGVLKEYQCERLNPDTHHQKASQTSIAIGGLQGAGWKQGEYFRGGSLPAPYTDSIFAAFGEEFGFIGLVGVLGLYYALIYCSFQASASAKDSFGRLISAGIAVYIAIHVLINVGMLCGCFPITGVPLLLLSYGGSSMVITMMALGLQESIYSRRFMF
jgi:rod shape determining protein RodA